MDSLKAFFRQELQTTLAQILGPAGRLLASDLSAEQRADVETIERNARALLDRTDDLLGAAVRIETRFRRLIEANIIGVVFADAEGRIFEANDAFLAMVQYTREDVAAGLLRWDDITPSEYTPFDQNCLEEGRSAGRVCQPFEKEYKRKDGTRIPVLVGVAWFDDKPSECVAFVLDLSEFKKIDRVRQEFLATLSHELRTPLTAIVGWIKLIRTGRLEAKTVQTGIESIERNAELQARLVDDIIDMSRIITGQMQMDFEPVDVGAVVRDSVRSVRPEAEQKGLKLTEELATLPDIWGHIGRLHQVMANLLVNAVKFTPPGGDIRVTASTSDAHVEIRVSDTGVGIKPEFLPHVFEPFRQEDATTTRRHGGMGLGLAIARNLVQLHGGTIRAESNGEGQGSTFTVTLPTVDRGR